MPGWPRRSPCQVSAHRGADLFRWRSAGQAIALALHAGPVVTGSETQQCRKADRAWRGRKPWPGHPPSVLFRCGHQAAPRGPIAQLVEHDAGSVGVRSSSLLGSTKFRARSLGVERPLGMRKAVGSIPTGSTRLRACSSPVEHRARTTGVAGSIPAWSTKMAAFLPSHREGADDLLEVGTGAHHGCIGIGGIPARPGDACRACKLGVRPGIPQAYVRPLRSRSRGALAAVRAVSCRSRPQGSTCSMATSSPPDAGPPGLPCMSLPCGRGKHLVPQDLPD